MSLWSDVSATLVRRRSLILAILVALPFPILFGRIFYLQNIVGQKYRKLAKKNRIRIRPLRPERGEIVDRHGVALAKDRPAFRLVMIREQCPSPRDVLSKLQKLVPLTDDEIQKTLKAAYRRAPFTPVTVKRHLSFKDLAKVQLNQPDLDGLDFKQVPLRDYGKPAEAESLSHLVGYVGRTDNYKIDKADVKGWAPDFPVGRQGLEKLYEKSLGGLPGFLEMENNAKGRPIRDLERKDAVKGDTLQLTLDAEIQQFSFDRLRGNVGSVVLMDVTTGAILSAVSKPGFDPNDFSEGIDKKTWKRMVEHPDNPLLNRALQGMYSPGSTFKPIVAYAAINEGLVTLDEKIKCNGKTKLGRREFHCWSKHGTVQFHKAIASSCDIYFYEMAKRLGANKLAEYSELFGLGSKSLIGLPEKSGLVPTPEWKWRKKKERWTTGESYNYGIGQGFLLTTPLQMCTMCARIATGMEVKGSLLKKNESDGFSRMNVNVSFMDEIRKGMFDVVNNMSTGTAKSARRKGYKMSGKTGTVQVVSRRIEKGVKMSSVPLKQRPHGMFIGYAPSNNPKFAVAVVVENGGSGSGAASPVAADVLEQAMHALDAGRLV